MAFFSGYSLVRGNETLWIIGNITMMQVLHLRGCLWFQ